MKKVGPKFGGLTFSSYIRGVIERVSYGTENEE